MPTRVCNICNKEKALDEFPEHRPGRRRSLCRECFNLRRDSEGYVKPEAARSVSYDKVVIKEKLDIVVEHRLKAENRDLRARNEDLARQLAEGSEFSEIIKAAMSSPMRAPKIAPRERKSKLREGTPLVLASDWHVEQEIKSEAVAGRNRYNLQIATQRMQRFFEAVRWAVNQQRDTFKIRDLILWLGGDFIQNFLHEDDVENNLLPPLEAVLFIQAEMVKGLLFLLEDPEIEQFVIPCNDGNHGRTTKKMRSSTRMQHSLEVFLYAQLKLRFANEPRLKFVMPTSQFTYLDNVYDRTIRFLHGDVFKFAGGVGGIMIPMMKALARWETVKKADLTCMGHWHQRICLPDVIVNGSLCGYDSYAMGGGFPFQHPVQALRMLDPKRWCGSDIPLWVSELSDDSTRSKG